MAQGEDDWDLEEFSQELRLVSPPGRDFDWTLGAFYTHENTTEVRYNVAFSFGVFVAWVLERVHSCFVAAAATPRLRKDCVVTS